MEDVDPRPIPKHINFLLGAIAGTKAALIIQPVELIKCRKQIQTKGNEISLANMLRDIYKNEGFLGFYNGTSAAVLRQCTYTMARLGTYSGLYDSYISHFNQHPTLTEKVCMGALSGAVGGTIGNPADLSMVRMTTDSQLPVEQQRKYASVFHALIRICKEEGFINLFRGVGPSIARGMVVNGTQLAAYSHAREFFFPYFKEGVVLHFWSAMVSGIVTTCVSMPADTIKTRVQSSNTPISIIGMFKYILKTEGIVGFYKGIFPFYVTLGPQIVLIFIFLERWKLWYREWAYPDFVWPDGRKG